MIINLYLFRKRGGKMNENQQKIVKKVQEKKKMLQEASLNLFECTSFHKEVKNVFIL